MGIYRFGIPIHDSQVEEIDKSLDNHLICDSSRGIDVFEHGEVIFESEESNFESIVVVKEIRIFLLERKLIVYKMAYIIVLCIFAIED